jgi:EAL domain-containing protein (putative c-di-GMP-specific phosphodiesterase class I)/GGDEF domain-containing protein
MPRDHSDPVNKLFSIIENRRLTVLFQPIIDLAKICIFGYEGQIRGPSDDLLHSSVLLYRLAKQADRLLEFENLRCQLTVDSFVELKLQGFLFLRLDVDVFLKHKFKEVQVVQAIEKAGIDPQCVVITLCVNEPYDISNPHFLPKIISRYAELGYKIALEDQGEIFQSRPEIFPTCVKINQQLIQDVDKDPTKVQLLKSLLESAASSGFITFADGIETRGELRLIKELGISLGQGSFIARPGKKPARIISSEVSAVLSADDELPPKQEHSGINAILEYSPAFTLENNNEEVFQVFEKNPQLSVIAVTNNNMPVGLINRSVFINRFARPYQRELYGKKSCSTFMDPEPLIVDKHIAIQELSGLLATDMRHISLGFIFTENGLYLGVGTSQKLIHEITEMQIQSARYANPLTGLPGNSPIDEHVDALLESGDQFCICYFDLDSFKPFNDVYGFSMGDAIIQMTAKIISLHCDAELDFIGHIGGDDFIVLFRSTDWESRCQSILDQFSVDVISFFKQGDIDRGGYIIENRRGEKEFHNLTCLSVGAVPVTPMTFKSHREIAVVATEAKKMAKKVHGNSLFINQRDYAK